jgi:hypothetical protein
MEDGDLEDAVRALFEKQQAETNEEDYKRWCSEVSGVPKDYELLPKAGWLIDQEFQPTRWLAYGLHILKAATQGTGQSNGIGGHTFAEPVLSYAIFQVGAELFLKGMWLCQFADCRELSHNGYLEPLRRQELGKHLRVLGHDLLKLIESNRSIAQYNSSPEIVRFLAVTEGLVRFFYYPIYEVSKRDWASSRYPKRFYDDKTYLGASDASKIYPQTSYVIRLFGEAEARIDDVWSLRKTLAAKQ